ncbi:MAG TPA: SDR family oxidoreductase [Egibacteraceae bacterium]|jgi:NAD(P)-dependent dehydrogenase (short-subunit alcohol dehydrogenase family)|nr:SDR family oxidoreductase [Egibacteraceae bacterium]
MPSPSTTARGVAVVTGGTAGIGRASVRCLAERGWDVGVIARGQDRLDATVAEVERLGRRAVAVSADVADAAALDDAADRIEATLGPIDVWVNNAFTGAIAFFEEVTPKEFERITGVTYLGFVNGTRTALARMATRNRGTIIQVGSALAFRGIPLQAAYCGAKHAIVGFTESVRTELLHKGLDINLCSVHMPGVNTPQFGWVLHRGIDHHPMPVPPIYQPEVAGRAVAHVAEHPRRSMWVGLPTVLTILGNRFAPSLLDRFLARTNVEDQQSPDHDPPGERSNTWEPVPGGDIAAHGAFDDQAHARSPELWLSLHRGAVAAAGAALLGIAAAAAGSRRS